MWWLLLNMVSCWSKKASRLVSHPDGLVHVLVSAFRRWLCWCRSRAVFEGRAGVVVGSELSLAPTVVGVTLVLAAKCLADLSQPSPCVK